MLPDTSEMGDVRMLNLLCDTNLLIGKPDLSVLGVPLDGVTLRTSAICYAELLEGEFTADPIRAARAVLEVAGAQANFGEALPFGTAEVQAYRAVCAATVRCGRTITRRRRVDMMIAATALANGLTLATRNVEDFAAVEGIVPIVQL